MKPLSQPWRRVSFATALLAAALLMGHHGLSRASLREPNMTPLPARLQPVFEKTKTVCLAGFLSMFRPQLPWCMDLAA